MRSIVLLLVLFLFTSTGLLSQKEGDQWVLGYSSQMDPDFSIFFMDFSQDDPSFFLKRDINNRLSGTLSNICDTSGSILFWTNGMNIMANSGYYIADTIAFIDHEDFYWNNYTFSGGAFGFPAFDAALILPVPGSNGVLYITLYHHAEVVETEGIFKVTQFYSAGIKFDSEHDILSLLYQDVPIGPYLKYRQYSLKALRHANGRDWWIFTFPRDSDEYHVFKLDPQGIKLSHIGTLDMQIKTGLGQSAFSADGKYFTRLESITLDEGQYIHLFDVDRCAGTLTRKTTLHTEAGIFAGTAFSPSGQYVYATSNNSRLWQWDMMATDIAASKTLIDTFDGFVQPGWFPITFGSLVEAPDGRIYGIPPNGGCKYMHVIDRPNLHGKESKFLQHHINFEVWNARTPPNLPNYRLGPIDGSPCDTLGIDNHCVARWRYEEDTPWDWHTIRFTDLSFFEPDTWHWDFDDGTTTDERHPLHTFGPGLYHVCLTVSNEYATDSMCRWVEILTTSLHEEQQALPDLQVHPNPFSDNLTITSRSGVYRSATLDLVDLRGKVVFHADEVPVPLTIALPDIATGIYFLRIQEADGTITTHKVVKQ